MACGYFIHNLVDSICGDLVNMNPQLWFPIDGKESELCFMSSGFSHDKAITVKFDLKGGEFPLHYTARNRTFR